MHACTHLHACSGKRGSTATVVYKFSSDAEEAARRYNGIGLDHMRLSVVLAGSSAVTKLSSGIRVMRHVEDAGAGAGVEVWGVYTCGQASA